MSHTGRDGNFTITGATEERAYRIAAFFSGQGIPTTVSPEKKGNFSWWNIETDESHFEEAKALYESVRTKRVHVSDEVTVIKTAPWDVKSSKEGVNHDGSETSASHQRKVS